MWGLIKVSKPSRSIRTFQDCAARVLKRICFSRRPRYVLPRKCLWPAHNIDNDWRHESGPFLLDDDVIIRKILWRSKNDWYCPIDHISNIHTLSNAKFDISWYYITIIKCTPVLLDVLSKALMIIRAVILSISEL